MFKLAGRIIDQYSDPQFGPDALLSEVGVPTAEEVAALPDSAFALVVKTASGKHRFFPMHTVKTAKVSAAYFNEYGYQLPTEWREKTAEALKTAKQVVTLPDETPGVPVVSQEQFTKIAHEAYLQLFDRMTPGERVKAAVELTDLNITDERVTDYQPAVTYGGLFKQGMIERKAILADSVEKSNVLAHLQIKLAKLDALHGALLLDEFDQYAKVAGRTMDAFKTCWGKQTTPAHKPDRLLEEQVLINSLKDKSEYIFDDLTYEAAKILIKDPWAYYQQASPAVRKYMLEIARKEINQSPKPVWQKKDPPGGPRTAKARKATPGRVPK